MSGIKTFIIKIKNDIQRKKCERTGTVFDGANVIGNSTWLSNVHVGYGTYIGDCSYFEASTIGKYCSISGNVKVIQGVHPTQNWVSTHPAFFSTRKQCGICYVNNERFEEMKYVDVTNKLALIIGNDVWIGYGVMILSGIRIGDGAVIAAGAVVVSDVPEYAIVGGVPAKIIKYRFTNEEIAKLKSMKWWEKDEKWIKEHALLFNDIKNFIKINDQDEVKCRIIK